MGTVHVVGEGGAEFVLDDQVPYVAEQLGNGQLRLAGQPAIDDGGGGEKPKRPRRRPAPDKDTD